MVEAAFYSGKGNWFNKLVRLWTRGRSPTSSSSLETSRTAVVQSR